VGMSYKQYDHFRRKSTRLQKWDYKWEAWYFVTINTKNGKEYLGKIIDNEIKINEIGKIAKEEWLKTPDIRPDMNILLGKFIIMPNHMHALIKIGENQYNSSDAMHRVGTINGIRKKIESEDKHGHEFASQKKNLSSIIRGFKSKVKIKARIINKEFAWKPRFNDQIVFDDEHYKNCKMYIQNNPSKWEI